MKNRTNIELVVARVLAGSLASTIALTVGCGGISDASTSSSSSSGSSSGGSSSGGSSSGGSSSGGTSSGGSSSGGVEPWSAICANGAVSLVSGFNPAQPAQYIERRSENAYPDGRGGLQFGANTLEKVGRVCDLSPPGSACYTQFAATRVLPETAAECAGGAFAVKGGFGGDGSGGCAVDYLLHTSGGTVGVAQTLPEVKAFFGSIDAPAEAFYIAQQSGYTLSCSDGPAPQWRAARGGGYELRLQKRTGVCQDGIIEAIVVVSSSGTLTSISETVVRGEQPCAIGRRPEGLCDLNAVAQLRATGFGDDAVGAFFAEAAKLEAASVHAFARMHIELQLLGANPALLGRVDSARKDEIRHARATAQIARRFGHAPQRATIGAHRSRSLVDIALENAVEGCVRETYGAVVAAYQARTAQDPQIALALSEIARDEAAHAQLSWDVAAFLDAKLTADERVQVARAQTAAEAELLAELASAPAARLVELAGLPTASIAQALLAATLSELRA
jgi:hypothetical protein